MFTIITGSICRNILKKWQLCATGSRHQKNNELYINLSTNIAQQQNENDIVQLNSFLGCLML